MKHVAIIMVVIVTCIPHITADVLCMGRFITSQAMVPDMHCYYKGNKLALDVKSNKPVATIPFSFMEDKNCQQLCIVVASQIRSVTQDNTVQKFVVPFGVPYKAWKLQADREYKGNGTLVGYTWQVTPVSLNEQQEIPDNTLMVVFDASLVRGLLPKVWNPQSKVRIIPDIVVYETVSKKQLQRAGVAARLAALDIDMLHQRSKTVTQQQGTRSVAYMMV